jgi:PAS domain S-box-containing protein
MLVKSITSDYLSKRFRLSVLISCGITYIVAIMGLLGYLPGLHRLGSVYSDFIPMAPSTAISFLILSSIIILSLYRQIRGAARLTVLSLSGVVSIFGLLKCIEYFIAVELSFEQGIVPISGQLGDIPVGIMSPSTGGLFFIAGIAVVSLVLRRAGDSSGGFWTNVIGVLGLVTAVVGGGFVLGYLHEDPFLYGMGTTVPMAITTAVAFVATGICLIAVAGPNTMPLKGFMGPSINARLLRVFVPLVMVVLLVDHYLLPLITKKLAVHYAFINAFFTVIYAFVVGLGTVRIGAALGIRLNEAEEELNLVINASPIGICTVDTLGNFVTTNTAYERMVGYSKEECRSLSFFDVTHPNDRPKNKKLFQSMFSLETTGFSMKKRYIRKDGSVIDVVVHAVGIMDAEGNIRFGTAFVDDITERKRAQDSLREKNEDLERFVNVATDRELKMVELKARIKELEG